MEKIISTTFFILTLFFSMNVHAEKSDDLNKEGAELAEKGKKADAFKKFQEAVEENPRNFKAQSNLGDMAFELGLKKAAYDAFSAYVKLDPKAENRIDVIKKLVKLRGELNEAPPKAAFQKFESGKSHVKEKKYSEAHELFEDGLQEAPWAIEGYFLKASSFAIQGEKEKALEQMDEYGKYTDNKSDVDSKRSEIESLLSQYKKVEEVEEKAESKEDMAKSAEKTAGLTLMYGIGIIMPNNNAHSSRSTDTVTYKDALKNPTSFDLHFYHVNPDTNLMLRVGYSHDSFKARGTEVPVLVNPDLSLTTVNVKSTDMTWGTGYIGVGLAYEVFYFVFDLGMAFISVEDLETSVTSGSTEIKHIPTSETAMIGAMSFGMNLPINSLIELNVEGRYSAPPFSTIYENSKNTGTKPGVEGAKWFGTFKVYAGASIRF